MIMCQGKLQLKAALHGLQFFNESLHYTVQQPKYDVKFLNKVKINFSLGVKK